MECAEERKGQFQGRTGLRQVFIFPVITADRSYAARDLARLNRVEANTSGEFCGESRYAPGGRFRAPNLWTTSLPVQYATRRIPALAGSSERNITTALEISFSPRRIRGTKVNKHIEWTGGRPQILMEQ